MDNFFEEKPLQSAGQHWVVVGHVKQTNNASWTGNSSNGGERERAAGTRKAGEDGGKQTL